MTGMGGRSSHAALQQAGARGPVHGGDLGDCKHEAIINVDSLPDDTYVPDVALRLRCSACGSKKITTRPDPASCQQGRLPYRSRSELLAFREAEGLTIDHPLDMCCTGRVGRSNDSDRPRPFCDRR
jgi:hypothetical protein